MANNRVPPDNGAHDDAGPTEDDGRTSSLTADVAAAWDGDSAAWDGDADASDGDTDGNTGSARYVPI